MNVSPRDGREISPPTPPASLSYASQPVAGTITWHRTPGALVVTMCPSSRRIYLLLGGVVLCAAVTAVAGIVWLRFQDDPRKIVHMAFCLALIVSGVGGVFALLKALVVELRTVTLEVAGGEVALSVRTFSDIARQTWPAQVIIGSRVMRLPPHQDFLRRYVLEIWQAGGTGWRLIMRSRAEVQAVQRLLVEALGFQTLLSPAPAQTPGRRLRFSTRPGCIEFTFCSPFWGLTTIACYFVAFVIGVCFDRWTNPREWGIWTDSFGPLPRDTWAVGLRLILYTLFAGHTLAWLAYRLKRVKILSVTNGQLTIIERAPRSPLRNQWRCHDIAEFSVAPDAPDPGGNGRLVMRLADNSLHDLIEGETAEELNWVRARLLEDFGTGNLPAANADAPPDAATIILIDRTVPDPEQAS
jgi:hypothetical protein